MTDTQSVIFNMVKVLHVEDSDDYAATVKEMISDIPGMGFELCHVNSIADAERAFSDNVFDVVLLDMNLPNGTGIEAVNKVLAFSGETPIVIMSGHDDEEMARKSVKNGVQDYLVKSDLNPRGFKRAISHALYRTLSRKRIQDERERVKMRVIRHLEAVGKT